MSTTTRRIAFAGRILREALLMIAALAGAACIVLVILAFTGGYSLIMFKTGSMSPTIPAGSVALVQKIPAAEIAVGDVITVDRPGALPITHRVTSVSDSTSDVQRVITMRGDANEVDDPLPYTISEGRIVRGSVPHLAHVIVWFGNPIVLGGITIGAAILVTWAFWPRDPKPKIERPSRLTESRVGVTTDDQDAPPQTRRERRAASLLSVGILLGAVAAVGLGASPPAGASSSALTMTSDLNSSEVRQLDTVDPFYWHVDVNAEAVPDDGELFIDMSGTGDAGFALYAEVRACAVAWQSGNCAQREQMLRANAPVALDGGWTDLLQIPTPDVSYLRLSLTADVVEEPSASGTLTVRATAQGTWAEETINGSGQLPDTGGQAWGILAAPAAVLVGLGVALAVGARRRHSPREASRR